MNCLMTSVRCPLATVVSYHHWGGIVSSEVSGSQWTWTFAVDLNFSLHGTTLSYQGIDETLNMSLTTTVGGGRGAQHDTNKPDTGSLTNEPQAVTTNSCRAVEHARGDSLPRAVSNFLPEK